MELQNMCYNYALALPLKLTLIDTDKGPRLNVNTFHKYSEMKLPEGTYYFYETYDNVESVDIEFNTNKICIGVDGVNGDKFIEEIDYIRSVEVIVDTIMYEVILNDGEIYAAFERNDKGELIDASAESGFRKQFY